MTFILAVLSSLIIMTGLDGFPSSDDNSGKSQRSDPLFSFGIITDVHYSDSDPSGTRFYRNSLDKLAEAVTGISRDNPSFIVCLGDLIDKDFESYKPVQEILFNSGIKVYYAAGNHDYSVDDRQKKKIPPLQHEKSGYYSVTEKGFRFIFLNGNEISTYSTTSKKTIEAATALIGEMKQRNEVNAIDWNGGISKTQLEWLDAQLTMAGSDNQKVFIFCHFPVFPENEHNLLNYNELLSILRKHNNVVAWFSGHNHNGNYGNFNMIHFVTLRAMVETEKSNSFSLVEVYSNRIWIKGYGREKNQILAY